MPKKRSRDPPVVKERVPKPKRATRDAIVEDSETSSSKSQPVAAKGRPRRAAAVAAAAAGFSDSDAQFWNRMEDTADGLENGTISREAINVPVRERPLSPSPTPSDADDDARIARRAHRAAMASAEPAMETAWSARSDAEFEVESEMVAVRGREAWLALLPEMLAVCNEAARRCALKKDASARVYDEPLCADYVYERVALAPGPLGPTGFVAWHRATRKMQGFVVLCEFCTFSRSLKWDSRHAAALAGSFEQGGATMQARRKAACPPRGTSVAECVSAAERVAVASSVAALKRCVDEGALSDKLQREPSEPRPQQLATYGDEILVWPTLLEVALLGALGCGGRLVDRAL